mgnify:FL=1
MPITDEKMTRFWITLKQAVDFVLKSFERMQGGEIFVPKIPSIRVVDLARAMAPKSKIKIIGIRPGEKLHEKMCSIHEVNLTLEFKDHYLIQPSINFYDKDEIDYSKNNLKEVGKLVQEGFEYRSDNNKHFLSIEEIKKLNK